eukprot:6214313-Pleurochrysis_carterae.AAC.5
MSRGSALCVRTAAAHSTFRWALRLRPQQRRASCRKSAARNPQLSFRVPADGSCCRYHALLRHQREHPTWRFRRDVVPRLPRAQQRQRRNEVADRVGSQRRTLPARLPRTLAAHVYSARTRVSVLYSTSHSSSGSAKSHESAVALCLVAVASCRRAWNAARSDVTHSAAADGLPFCHLSGSPSPKPPVRPSLAAHVTRSTAADCCAVPHARRSATCAAARSGAAAPPACVKRGCAAPVSCHCLAPSATTTVPAGAR